MSLEMWFLVAAIALIVGAVFMLSRDVSELKIQANFIEKMSLQTSNDHSALSKRTKELDEDMKLHQDATQEQADRLAVLYEQVDALHERQRMQDLRQEMVEKQVLCQRIPAKILIQHVTKKAPDEPKRRKASGH